MSDFIAENQTAALADYDLIDEKTFLQIMRELADISIRLIYSGKDYGWNRKEKYGFLNESQWQLEQMDVSIREIEKVLKSLDRDPMSDMVSQPALRPFRQVKHLDANAIYDHYVLNKRLVRTRVNCTNYDIYENQKIYGFLAMLLERLKYLEADINDKAENPVSDVWGRKEDLRKLCEKASALQDQLKKTMKKDMFKDIKKEKHLYPVRSTNLFVNHPKYRQMFHMMKNYQEMGQIMESMPDYACYHKSCTIYEVWCFFKTMNILMSEYGYEISGISLPDAKSNRFHFESVNDYRVLAHLIRDYINSLGDKSAPSNLEGLMIRLVKDDKEIYLGYNCTFRGKAVERIRANSTSEALDGKLSTQNVRPDIVMIINRELFFTCDAKYKNYRSEHQGIQTWLVDLFECAAFKYIYRLDINDVKNHFEDADLAGHELTNCGCCIFTPAKTDDNCTYPAVCYYGGDIKKLFNKYLDYLDNGMVNHPTSDGYCMNPDEYSKMLYEDIVHNEEYYEHKVASTRFLPGDYLGFKNIFLNVFKYGEPHFLEAANKWD